MAIRDAHAEESGGTSSHQAVNLQRLLSPHELRGIRFIQRYPWVPALAIAFFWVSYLGSAWYQFGVFAEHGGEVGIASRADAWNLAHSWSHAKRALHPYEVFVIERVNTIVWEGALLAVLTMFAIVAHFQNRLLLKLVRALRTRVPTTTRAA